MVPIVDKTPTLSCPLLGLFGNDDQYPSPAQVDELEEALKANGKTYEFHRYEGAGHAFFSVNRPSYRPEAATDGWEKIFAFYGKYLSAKGEPRLPGAPDRLPGARPAAPRTRPALPRPLRSATPATGRVVSMASDRSIRRLAPSTGRSDRR